MHDFFIYNGATDIEDGCGFAAGDVVVKLCQTHTRGDEHLIFFDNYVNFIEFSQKLRDQGFFSCGTIRRDRLRGMPVVKDSIMRKKGRGSYVAHNDTVSGVKVIQRFDNKSVLMSSTFYRLSHCVMSRGGTRRIKNMLVYHVPILSSNIMPPWEVQIFMTCSCRCIKSITSLRGGTDELSSGYYPHALCRAGLYTSGIFNSFNSPKRTV